MLNGALADIDQNQFHCFTPRAYEAFVNQPLKHGALLVYRPYGGSDKEDLPSGSRDGEPASITHILGATPFLDEGLSMEVTVPVKKVVQIPNGTRFTFIKAAQDGSGSKMKSPSGKQYQVKCMGIIEGESTEADYPIRERDCLLRDVMVDSTYGRGDFFAVDENWVIEQYGEIPTKLECQDLELQPINYQRDDEAASSSGISI